MELQVLILCSSFIFFVFLSRFYKVFFSIFEQNWSNVYLVAATGDLISCMHVIVGAAKVII